MGKAPTVGTIGGMGIPVVGSIIGPPIHAGTIKPLPLPDILEFSIEDKKIMTK
jgi:hypothetical protein